MIELRKVINWLSYGVLGLAFLLLLLLGYWTVTGSDVLEIKNAPVPVRTIREHPTADGVVILKLNYCKKVNATGRVRVSFFNSSREIFLPVYEDHEKAKCEVAREAPILIPTDIVPGRYQVKFRITYDVNPIKDVVEEFDSKEFEVVAK